jgi:hypothetical protein
MTPTSGSSIGGTAIRFTGDHFLLSSLATCVFNETIVTIATVESSQSAVCLSPQIQGVNATDVVRLYVQLAFGDARYASPEPFSVFGKTLEHIHQN